MARRTEIRIAGRAGQGILTIGKILAFAFGSEEKNVVLAKVYSATVRSGGSNTDLIVTDRGEEVDFPEVLSANLLVALTQEAYDANIEDIDPLGVAIVDSDNVKDMRENPCKSILGIQFSKLATQKLGNEMLANVLIVLILGKICMVSNENLRGAIRKNLPRLEDKIIDKAIDLVKAFDKNIKDVIEIRTGETRIER